MNKSGQADREALGEEALSNASMFAKHYEKLREFGT